jgi:hypothetical protein
MTRPDYWQDCTVACEARQVCGVCGRRKKPVGRHGPLEMANGMCDDDCAGYRLAPEPGHLWPGEIADMDRVEDDA